jgi:hypothetical protein
MTDVTIRGIDDDVYSKFAAEAKRRGISIGELTTIAMGAVVSETSGPNYRIESIDSLVVSKVDLESLEGAVTLADIDLLEFDDTVDWPTFSHRVKEIVNVDILVLPKGLSKFQVLTKSKNVDLIRSKK